MLFRAQASIRESAGTAADAVRPPTTVFFEHPTYQMAAARLRCTLLGIWQVEASQIEVGHLVDEQTLLVDADSLTPPDVDDADVRLMEIGQIEGWPRYCLPENTLFLVRPSVLPRLCAAQNNAALQWLQGA